MQGNLFSRVDIYSVPANLQCSKEKCQSRAIIEGTFSLSNANGKKLYPLTVSVFASQMLANLLTIDNCLSVFSNFVFLFLPWKIPLRTSRFYKVNL